LLANARLSIAIEDDRGKQNLRFRTAFQPTRLLMVLGASAAAVAASTALVEAWTAASIACVFILGLASRTRSDWNMAAGQIGAAVAVMKQGEPFFESKMVESSSEVNAEELMAAAGAAE
jgi:hypothetical protein